MNNGKILSWNNDRGFGFIRQDSGGPNVFFHVSATQDDASRFTPGAAVSFEVVECDRGLKGEGVTVLGW